MKIYYRLVLTLLLSLFSLSVQAKVINVAAGLVDKLADGSCSLIEALEVSQGIVASNADCPVIEDASVGVYILKVSQNYQLTTRYTPSNSAAFPNIVFPVYFLGSNNASFTINSGTAKKIMQSNSLYLYFNNVTLSNTGPEAEGCLDLLNGQSVLMLTNFENCHSKNSGGAIYHTGTILYLSGSSIKFSSSADSGGAIYNGTGSEARIFQTSFIGNSATSFGGVINNGGKMTLEKVSIIKNNGDYAIVHNYGQLDIFNSTIAGNHTSRGGTVNNSTANLSGIDYNGQLNLYSVTITENADDSNFAALDNQSKDLTGVNIYNSLVVGNSYNCSAQINNIYYSYIGKNENSNLNSCLFKNAVQSSLILNSLITLIPDQTEPSSIYYYLSGNSKGIDEGDPAGCKGPGDIFLARDQRGKSRSLDGDQNGSARCDMGAIEIDRCSGQNCYGDQNADDDRDGLTEVAGDCDDTNNQKSPNFTEICDGLDNNCDNSVDNAASDEKTFYLDSDKDGYGNSLGTTKACTVPVGYSENNLDCDDSQSQINPSKTEICDDSFDQNCDGSDLSCNKADQDGDGFTPETGDCDDSNANKAPNKTEVCDSLDNNCNESVDENLGQLTCGTGLCANTVNSCVNGIIQVCGPKLPQAEVCGDTIDQDCDGTDLVCPVIPDNSNPTPPTPNDSGASGDPENPSDSPVSSDGDSSTNDQTSDTTTGTTDTSNPTDESQSSAASGGGCSMHKEESKTFWIILVSAYFLITALMRGLLCEKQTSPPIK